MALSSAVDASAVARVLGIKTIFKDLRAGSVTYLPQRIAVVGQGASASVYATTKRQVTSAFEAGGLYGFGSPVHLAVKELMPVNGDGVGSIPVTVYPLEDAAAAVAAAGDITPSGTATGDGSYTVKVNNIVSEAFLVETGDTVADIAAKIVTAVNANVNMPVIAAGAYAVVDGPMTGVDLTAKWKGASGNDLHVEVVGPTDIAVTYAITQPTSGATNPDVTTALNQVGNVWETMFVNCFESTDTTILGEFSTFGEGRWGALVRKPMVAFSGSGEATVATAIAVPDARKTDRTNVQLSAPGSNNLPLSIAAAQVARIAVVANNNPPHDYGSQPVSSITPGTDAQQWTYTQRDAAVKGGSSTIEVRDGVPYIADVVTYYHPSGDPVPAYRYVVDIVKLQNVIFNLDLIFNVPAWDGAPLIPDNQPTSNRSARKPKSAVAAVNAMLDNLGLEAMISDPETAKASTQAEIDSANPKRLNLTTTIQVSGNTNIKSVDLNFGFFFGTSAVVA